LPTRSIFTDHLSAWIAMTADFPALRSSLSVLDFQ
jgi:hypothetical protein